ncbi:MAG TPA: hypothetical protein VLX91_05835 [Candidatus Acidoferrales bacterium]|nr:hypothetical protein [Candidatus Acidoferrales bacterium]
MKPLEFDIPATREFFSGYLIDHFLYKQYTLFNALEKLPELKSKILDGLVEINEAEYAKTLRLEIRATYFQAIETLFELIFSLEPRSNVIDNRQVWYFLSTSRWRENYKRIESIAASDTAFLDQEINANENLKVPFIQYLFYFGVTNPSMQDAVRRSLNPIKKFLIEFAKEFSDRDEYNAFKHSLRILPTLQKVEFGTSESEKPVMALDMSNSMTYLVEEGESISFRTKPLDTLRDMRMGLVCSYLISNIVRSRRVHFTKKPEGHLHTFSDETFPSANARNVNWTNFRLTIKPIYDTPTDSSK